MPEEKMNTRPVGRAHVFFSRQNESKGFDKKRNREQSHAEKNYKTEFKKNFDSL